MKSHTNLNPKQVYEKLFRFSSFSFLKYVIKIRGKKNIPSVQFPIYWIIKIFIEKGAFEKYVMNFSYLNKNGKRPMKLFAYRIATFYPKNFYNIY